ncbi:SPOR domain-containing protein [Chitinophagaceae bacterium LB-8]|uniref:SPOR domain-containing protein n=1 Tax=Paraflavisolibacter caeni TaxID=2982496 RepID=A0A9X2XT54_9BACT|nr:SPOR domain-containing protein [Paraflavisolibacter caeni]MCU7548065.1 SPOR domain-containing protein [Paraflavisolibacter caeni]
MKYFLWLVLVLAGTTGFAQNDSAFRTASSVIVHKDSRIDLLVKKQTSINVASKKMYGSTMRGYRLLVMNTSKRDEAIAAKTKVYTYFPELKAYLAYQSPFFRLKAGNFKTRDEAVRYQQQMKSMFPKGVFIVNDVIEVKPVKDDNEEQDQ